MTIQQAIEKAIDNGWKPKDWYFKTIIFNGLSNNKEVVMFSNERGEDSLWGEYCIEFILLDPIFWQCLGKAMGWDGYMRDGDDREILYYSNGNIFGWLAVQHHLIDHLASGQSVESFFKTLK